MLSLYSVVNKARLNFGNHFLKSTPQSGKIKSCLKNSLCLQIAFAWGFVALSKNKGREEKKGGGGAGMQQAFK